ncbi:MAG: hypothetical protein J6Z49_00045 [Kiritimatiellae bacterium]|nr:hypothetical protein [Kiritimatiellia bacterium]
MNRFKHAALLGIASAVLVTLAGCTFLPVAKPEEPVGGSVAAWTAVSNGAPVRVAVYVGPGARGVGMFRWMQIVDQAPELQATYVDGAAIRSGALRKVDLLVMPGGNSGVEANNLGTEGQRELRRFIEEGGSYVGTCAGAFLLMEGPSTSRKKKILGIVPFKHRKGEWGGEAMLQVSYLKEATELSGIKAGMRMERFHGGPVMDPADPIPGADFRVMAKFASNLHSYSAKPDAPTMGGGASAVAGTFGRGRVWLFSCHPEYYPSTWSSVKGAFKYVTGRDVTFSAPQRRKGQLAVGWWSKPGPGVEAAELARTLVRGADCDVVPYSTDELSRTGLRHIDALVVPDTPETNIVANLVSTNGMSSLLKGYLARGGRIVTWGRAAERFTPHANLLVAGKAQDVPQVLRELKNAPLPPPRPAPAPKSANPVRVAAYFDAGASGCAAMRWIKLLSLSPDCAFTAVNGADVRNGALANADLYIAPGGLSSTQYKMLEPSGCSNLVAFVRNGGGYFGTCAGCYLAMTRGKQEKPSSGRVGMLPYQPQKTPYRGGAELKIRFTDKAELFGFKPGETRIVRYHGGPVLLPFEGNSEAVVHPVATYACEGVFAYNAAKGLSMADTPALVAGTFGKGRIAVSSPHPESYTHTQDIIRGGLRYITGRSFESEYPQRTRGNLSVGMLASRLGKDGAMLVAQLYREPSIDLRAVAAETIRQGTLEHCDVFVLCHPLKDTFSSYITAFARNGGRLIVFEPNPSKTNVPEGLPNVTVCRDPEDVRKLLREE